jgi:hypothetical protein
MATNNSINGDSIPLVVRSDGTGLTTIGADGILYGNGASAIGVTAAGTAAQVLTSNGASSAPTYQAMPAGSLIEIQSQTASASATLSFTTGITSTYNCYLLKWAVYPGTSNVSFRMQVSTNGGSSYLGAGYLSGANKGIYSTNVFTNVNSTSVVLLSGGDLAGTNNIGCSGQAYLYNVTNGSNFCMSGTSSYLILASNVTFCLLQANSTINTINALQFSMSSGNISVGRITLYGIVE